MVFEDIYVPELPIRCAVLQYTNEVYIIITYYYI